jgi:hypothetical protein
MAGIPVEDARGKITCHRARSTIATQLFNAKEPMSLFELQGRRVANSPFSANSAATVNRSRPSAFGAFRRLRTHQGL